MAPLLVIDGDSLGHRAYHAMPAVEGAGGRPVGLLVGFANFLLATWRTTAPRAVLVCLDARTPSYRHELLPAYQGQRDPFADDLCEQLDRLAELTEAFGFAAVKVVPYEADDLLATAVTLEEARGGGALVVSGDRDMYQLVSDVTTVLHPRPRGVLEPVDRAGVRERYGIEPEQVTSLIALRGDPSDNIPGARGIGQKTAAELLRRYGDLEGVIAHAGELTPRRSSRSRERRRPAHLPRGRRDATRRARGAPGRFGAPAGGRRRVGERGGHARAGHAAHQSALNWNALGVEPDSLLVRGLADNPSGGLSPALDRSTTFERVPGGNSPYGRVHSPVVLEAEALLGALEDAEATVFASGMTAWTGICLTVLGAGRALALPTSGYYSLEGFSTEILERFGVDVRRYDARDAGDFRRACDGAALAIIETPSNPLLTLTDIEAAAHAAHAGGALLCCDSTFATPLLQRPLDLGADLAWQSATKYLSGHSDVLAGVVTTRDPGLRARLELTRRSTGGILAPDPAWLLLRGMRTLHVRLPRQVGTAAELARRARRASRCHRRALPRAAGTPRSRARAAADARRLRWRAGLRAARRRGCRALRGQRAARALRHEPRRRRDADRAAGRAWSRRVACPTGCCGSRSGSRTWTTCGPT